MDIQSALMQLASGIDNKLAMDDQNKLAYAYAQNPAYANAKFGLQNMAMKQKELDREQQRKDALRQLASGIVPTGINPSGQGQLNQRLGGNDFLSRYAQITGDLDPLVMMEREKAMSQLPSAGGTQAVLAERLMAENPNLKFSDALRQIQMGIREGIDFEGGQATPRMDIGTARGTVGGLEKYGTEMGGLQADLEMKPQIEQATQQSQEIGKERGVAQAKLESMTANMPKLENVVSTLKSLAEKATYSLGGKAEDFVQRQLGLDVGDDARARASFDATVSNEVLPLLRETFGAAFTVEEGNRLRETLGNADLSPSEKMVQLDAFIRAKVDEIASLSRREGVKIPSTFQIDPKEAMRQEAIRRGLIK
jgi:hypothetical protein